MSGTVTVWPGRARQGQRARRTATHDMRHACVRAGGPSPESRCVGARRVQSRPPAGHPDRDGVRNEKVSLSGTWRLHSATEQSAPRAMTFGCLLQMSIASHKRNEVCCAKGAGRGPNDHVFLAVLPSRRFNDTVKQRQGSQLGTHPHVSDPHQVMTQVKEGQTS